MLCVALLSPGLLHPPYPCPQVAAAQNRLTTESNQLAGYTETELRWGVFSDDKAREPGVVARDNEREFV